MDEAARRELHVAFRRGWREATVAFHSAVDAARRPRAEGGVQMLRYTWPGEVGDALLGSDYPLVVVVDNDDEFARLCEVRDSDDCPVVCLAGQKGWDEGIDHAEGCGHSIGWDIWEDTL